MTNTRVETIRYYEKEGLIPEPSRTSANYRVFAQAHLNWLPFIRRSRELGLTLDQVRRLLKLADGRSASCAQVDELTAENVAKLNGRYVAPRDPRWLQRSHSSDLRCGLPRMATPRQMLFSSPGLIGSHRAASINVGITIHTHRHTEKLRFELVHVEAS